MHAHGFCSSYSEVQKFKKCAAIASGTEITNYTSQEIQYSKDIVVQQICTLNGANTFNGMGMIAIVTPQVKAKTLIPR